MLAGDLDLALTQADQVLSDPDQVPPADAVRAGTVAAAVLARRGLLARSAELYRWMGTALEPALGTTAVLAVPALIGTGALDEAQEVLQAPRQAAGAPVRPPTLLAGAEELMAQGVYDSVAGSPTAALSQLTRAASLLEASQRAALLPDTPAALAALVAVHCGELDVAQSVLERAVRVRLGGPGAVTRHRLLLGWIALFRGATGGGALGARRRVAAGGRSGAARRAPGRGAGGRRWPGGPVTSRSLMPAWGRAREAIVRHPVDLFVLQQLGELSIAATRLRESSWVRPHLDEATELLARLGDPALWAAPLHWSALQAAIIAETPGRGAAARRGAGGGGGRQPVRGGDGRGGPALGAAAGLRGRRGRRGGGGPRSARRRDGLGGRQAGRPGGDPHPRPQGDERRCSAAPARCRAAGPAGPRRRGGGRHRSAAGSRSPSPRQTEPAAGRRRPRAPTARSASASARWPRWCWRG